jgi:hypothetical protein
MIASHAAGRLTCRTHFGERHSDAPSGEVHCQCKPDWTTPDDQDLGVDQMRHGAPRLSGAEHLSAMKDTCHVLSIQLVTRVTLHNIIVVIKSCAFRADRPSSQIAQPLAAKRTNLQSRSPLSLTGYILPMLVIARGGCHERLAHRS